MEEAYKYILNELGLKYNDYVVVACSGGPDSMALLYLLAKVKKAIDINVICAHVNHKLRVESEEEEKFVENFCNKNKIIFEVLHIENYNDDNFHNDARNKRYAFFSEVIKKYACKYLFTAHHGDDLIETILMRIVRGSTLKGYSGFHKISDQGSYKIVRPLIEVTKDEILEFDRMNKIDYRLDKSNTKEVYTRNRFRKHVLSFLKEEDSNVHLKFNKFSKLLEDSSNYINNKALDAMKKVCPQNIIDIELFLKEDYIIQTQIICSILERLYGDDLSLINDHHTQLILNLIKSRKASSSVCLPNGIIFVKSYKNIEIVKNRTQVTDYDVILDKYVNLPNGKNIEIVDKTNEDSNFICRLFSKDITLPLHIRNRNNGDKISVKGMLGTKKVSDIFINSKVKQEEREDWPIVVDSKENVVWIPGIKKSKFNRTKEEKCDIILRYY